jgi:hypothetical protein
LFSAESVLDGTILEIQVLESTAASSDRFRFSLGLLAEAPAKSSAMVLLN